MPQQSRATIGWGIYVRAFLDDDIDKGTPLWFILAFLLIYHAVQRLPGGCTPGIGLESTGLEGNGFDCLCFLAIDHVWSLKGSRIWGVDKPYLRRKSFKSSKLNFCALVLLSVWGRFGGYLIVLPGIWLFCWDADEILVSSLPKVCEIGEKWTHGMPNLWWRFSRGNGWGFWRTIPPSKMDGHGGWGRWERCCILRELRDGWGNGHESRDDDAAQDA